MAVKSVVRRVGCLADLKVVSSAVKLVERLVECLVPPRAAQMDLPRVASRVHWMVDALAELMARGKAV